MRDICVFDFDGSVSAQSGLMKAYSERIELVDLRREETAARLWTSPKRYAAIRDQAFRGRRPRFALIGSGDYHHYSLALVAQHQEPLTVVLFDNHPDWMRPPHQYHCGTWVYQLARLPQVERIVIVGLENGDIAGSKFSAGDVDSFQAGKIVLLPFRPVQAQIPQRGEVTLHSQLAADTAAGIAEVLDAIVSPHVYISVDKDCLRQEDASTNWEQGTLPLSLVLECIAAIRGKHTVVGADTVGDYSPPRFRSPLKWLGSLLDRPRNALRFAAPPTSLVVNQITNLRLLQALDGNP